MYVRSWTPDGLQLLTASRDGFVKVWQLLRGASRQKLSDNPQSSTGASTASTGTLLPPPPPLPSGAFDAAGDLSACPPPSLTCIASMSPFSGASVTAVAVSHYAQLSTPRPDLDATSVSRFQQISHDRNASGTATNSSESWLVAIGSDDGDLAVWSIPAVFAAPTTPAAAASTAPATSSRNTARPVLTVPPTHCHGSTVKRIAWRALSGSQKQEATSASCSAPSAHFSASCIEAGSPDVLLHQFASVSQDNTVRVHSIHSSSL